MDLQDDLRAGFGGHSSPGGKVAPGASGYPPAEQRSDAPGAAEAGVPRSGIGIVEGLELRDLGRSGDEDEHVVDDGGVSRLGDESRDIAPRRLRPVEEEAAVLVGGLDRGVSGRELQLAIDARKAACGGRRDGARIGRIPFRRAGVEPGQQRRAVFLREGTVAGVLGTSGPRRPRRHPARPHLAANQLLAAEDVGVGVEGERRSEDLLTRRYCVVCAHLDLDIAIGRIECIGQISSPRIRRPEHDVEVALDDRNLRPVAICPQTAIEDLRSPD